MKKKLVIMLVAAEITVFTYFALRGEYIHAFLIASALAKEAVHAGLI